MYVYRRSLFGCSILFRVLQFQATFVVILNIEPSDFECSTPILHGSYVFDRTTAVLPLMTREMTA